jgi:uncharacterized protein
MLWRDGRRSTNVEDQRGNRLSGRTKGGGIGIVILALIGMYFGIDPAIILNLGQNTQVVQSGPSGVHRQTEEERQLADFVSVVLADTEDTWNQLFRAAGKSYTEPTLVLFSGAVDSACGFAQAAMGPFYCPGDGKVYIDLSFYRDLKQQMNAPGDFAQAYVIAHEVGHHVQNLLAISSKMQALRRQVSESEYNRLSVKLELQADCFAGIWAHNADKVRQIVEPGDIKEALNAASQIGDDRLQQRHRGYVTPDSFTHGSSAQRVRWFQQGYQTGKVASCDSFNANAL